MIVFKKIILCTLSFLTVSTASTLLTIQPEKRLKAKISKDSMNRLAVKGDRIISVFGDNDSYDIQTEETSGQVFIKPNYENGEKPLSITVMTENNVVQDMLLEPVQKEASTLILTNTSKKREEIKTEFVPQAFGFEREQIAPCFKTHVLKAMKSLVLGMGEETDVQEGDEKRPSLKDVVVKCVKAISVNGVRGVIYEVSNKGDESIDLKEESFYISGDLALSFKVNRLFKNQKTYLYAVRS